MKRVLELVVDEQMLLLEEVERCGQHGLNRRIQHEQSAWLIDGSQRRYLEVAADTGTTTGIRITAIPDDDARLQAVRINGRPLEELLWICAFQASKGGLLPRCRRDDVIRLSHWPNFSRLPRTENALRITALLTTRATSVVLASRILRIEEAELYRFYSAACYAGYSIAVNRVEQVEPPAVAETPRLGIVRKLLSQLRMRPARLMA